MFAMKSNISVFKFSINFNNHKYLNVDYYFNKKTKKKKITYLVIICHFNCFLKLKQKFLTLYNIKLSLTDFLLYFMNQLKYIKEQHSANEKIFVILILFEIFQ